MKVKLKAVFNSTNHSASFLTAPTSGGVGSQRMRLGLPAFSLEALVCVQLGNLFWSEELMGLAADELIFIKPSSRLGEYLGRMSIEAG